ncbi:MAG: RNA recognition motif-containing protein [Thalassolituus oleivorans]|jgi:RNA recognition motif-containing protein
MKKLYVGNLPWRTTDADLEDLFASHGTVESAVVITDRETGRSRGFGFVEMEDAGATAAMDALDGFDIGGRALRVNEANDRPRRPQGGGGGGGGGGDRDGGSRW